MLGGVRLVTDEERRHRLAVRHALAPAHRAADPVAATRAMTVLHATEPASVHLAVWARVPDVTVADVERALYADRTLVRQLAMRRTLFVFPRDLLPAAWGSASARVAEQERRRTVKDLVASGVPDAEAWLAEASAEVVAALREHGGMTAKALREAVPRLAGRITVAPGTRWGGEIPVAPRVLTHLGASAVVVRGRNGGHWRTSRPRWELMSDWLDRPPPAAPAREGWAELARRWLATFGPGTLQDLHWWLGSTLTTARQALVDVGAVEVRLERDATGWLLPDDADPVGPVEPWAALLPVLDPTTMGWRDRTFFLGGHGPSVFDRNGNAGTTAWWCGRVVGCWVQDDHGRVAVVPLDGAPPAAHAPLEAEAARLTAWLDGVRVGTVYPSPLMRQARGG